VLKRALWRFLLLVACLPWVMGVPQLTNAQVAPVRSNQSQVGRYQLFQGTYGTNNLKDKIHYTTEAVFLLDTVSGEVKEYQQLKDDTGKLHCYWGDTTINPPSSDK
jgi:hypothetical protein